MTPLGLATPGTYTTDLWDTESTEAPGGIQVVNTTAPGTAALTGVALNEDAARAPVVGATVTLTDSLNNTTTTTTDSQGGFAFMDMPADTYTLTISSPPLGTYQLTNDTYAPDTTSEFTALVTTQPQSYDQSQMPQDSTTVTPPPTRFYPSHSRIPPTIKVADVKPDSLCAATISDTGAAIKTYDWKFYILTVAQNEVGGEGYNADAFKAFAVTASTYAWFWKMYPRSYLPSGADTDNSTHFQCFRPKRITNPAWYGWINEALKYRIVNPATKPSSIYDAEYKAGLGGNPSCSNPGDGVPTGQLSQRGLTYYSAHCSYSDWKTLVTVFYTNAQVVLVQVPVRPSTSATSFSGGVLLNFHSQVRNPITLLPYSDAWGFIVSHKVGGVWKTLVRTRWDETTRSIPEAFTVYTNACQVYRVAAWNPRFWSPSSTVSAWSNVNGGNPIGPTGVNC
jgi:hypothetical protein